MTKSKPTPESVRIAELNDRLRQHFIGGRVMMTIGVAGLEDETRMRVLRAVREFDAFDGDVDPYGEHDFGVVEVDGERYFFKVDGFDKNLEYASPDPANPTVTERVMTIMRADEY